ncbi:MAG: LysM peptidoglycan-binding domain-containing protein [Clostridia bacterium]|nr:LysM peptidoglycan-binding domain-containing protein [Clostridia bacterium]
MDRENINNSIKKSLKDEFCVWSEVGKTSAEKEISEEYILPDYLPDIRKILLVRVNNSTTETYKDEGKADLVGKVDFQVIYLADTGEIKCISREHDYELSAYADGIYEESYLDVRTGIKNKSARAVSPRKLLIKAKLVANVTVYNKLCVYPRVIGTTGIEDEFTLERSTNTTECVNYIKFSENDIRVSEDIVLQGNRTIKDLVCSDVILSSGECEYSDGKVNLKGNAKVWLLLDMSGEGEEGVYEVVERNVPFNHTAEVILPNGDWEICAKFKKMAFECGVANDTYGEPRVVEVDFSLKADVLAMTNESSVFTDDVYSTEYSYVNKYKEVETQKLLKNSNVNFSTYGSNPVLLTEGEQLENILFSAAEADVTSIEQKDGRVVFLGDCVVRTVLKTSDGGYKTEESVFPFKFEMPVNADGEMTYATNCFVIDHKLDLDSNKLNLNAEIGMNVSVFENVRESTVESISIDKSMPIEKPTEKVMTLYYPEENETLWNVAKKYGIAGDDIMKINKLANQNVLPRVILIPSKI